MGIGIVEAIKLFIWYRNHKAVNKTDAKIQAKVNAHVDSLNTRADNIAGAIEHMAGQLGAVKAIQKKWSAK